MKVDGELSMKRHAGLRSPFIVGVKIFAYLERLTVESMVNEHYAKRIRSDSAGVCM
jgi:uncharacterized membrane protein